MHILLGSKSRTAIGRMLVIIALSTCTKAMAQDGDQPTSASVHDVGLPDFLSFRSGTPTGNTAGGWLIRMSSVDDSAATSLYDDLDTSLLSTPDLSHGGYFHLVGNGFLDGHDGFAGCSNLCCDTPCPRVYGLVEALFLTRRPQLDNQPLVNDQTTGTTLLSTSNLNFNNAPGLRAMVGFGVGCGRAFEFSYLGLFSGNANAGVTKSDPNSFLTFQDNLVGNVFVDSDRVGVNYRSRIHSFAANFACCCGCCEPMECGEECGEPYGGGNCGGRRCQSLTWFTGFRYINFAEQFNMSAQKTVAGATENGYYNTQTANHLYGAQLGGRIRRTRGRFGWEGTGAAGLYVNNARQSQSVVDFPNFPLRNSSNSGNRAAFVGDINISGIYRLSNAWNLRAGYNVIWIQGLALAPDQIDTNFGAAQGGRRLNNSGGMLLHGANVGVEARY